MFRIATVIISIISLFILVSDSYASTDYILPYPAAMPGNPLYKVSLISEKLKKYWYFGDYGSFKYNLAYADKYLVEAKTLFEYKQYLLAYNALQKSNTYFKDAGSSIISARSNKKSTSNIESIYKEASKKHREVLQKIQSEVPDTFLWTPENEKEQYLQIHKLIQSSMQTRIQ